MSLAILVLRLHPASWDWRSRLRSESSQGRGIDFPRSRALLFSSKPQFLRGCISQVVRT